MHPSPLVFIVDDDPAALSSVGALLASFEYDVRAFGSAEEFLETDVDAERACVLCDIRLSGMSGLKLLKTLRSSGNTLPVILISGYADADTAAEAKMNGAMAVLDKPIDPRALVEHVQAAFEVSTKDGHESMR